MTTEDLSELVEKCQQITGTYYLSGVRSQLIPRAWLDLLTAGTGVDPDMHYVLDGVVNGFKVVSDNAEIEGYDCKNYASCRDKKNALKLNEIIMNELCQGKLSEACEKPTCVHAMGVVKKKDSKKIRQIIDCKRPICYSVNNFTDGVVDNFQFVTVDTVVGKIVAGKWYMSTVDLSNAYRSVLIHPENRKFFGIRFEETYLVDNFLCFGCRSSPFIFNRLTDCVARYMRDKGVDCFNYLDDIICVSESFEQGVQDQLFLIRTLRSLGFGMAWEKITSPSRVCTYLGIVIDSEKRKLCLPPERLGKLRDELKFWEKKRKATEKQLQVLIRRLGHCARIIRGGKLYMFFLFKKLHEAKSKKRVKLDDDFHQDLSWWRMFAEHFNSVSLCNVYEEGLWVSVCDVGNHVRVAGLEIDDWFSLSYTPTQAVFYEKEGM